MGVRASQHGGQDDGAMEDRTTVTSITMEPGGVRRGQKRTKIINGGTNKHFFPRLRSLRTSNVNVFNGPELIVQSLATLSGHRSFLLNTLRKLVYLRRDRTCVLVYQ